MRKKLTKNSLNAPDRPIPPFIFPTHDKSQQAWRTQLLKERAIRAIGPRLYTSLPEKQVPSAVKANWSEIVSQLFPHALLSHRSALEYRPTPAGEIFLTANTNREVQYPGLKIIFLRGPLPLSDDYPFLHFRVSSLPRALLENLSSTKRTAHRSLPVSEIEKKLEEILQTKGDRELNRIRTQARSISEKLKWRPEFKRLDSIIGALLGTRSSKSLQSAQAKSRAFGRPYDSSRLEKFDLLFSELIQTTHQDLKDDFRHPDHFRNKAFFEAYFSNYIEGTTFEIEEAEEIVFRKKIPKARPKDAHDILGTFQIVSDPNTMKQTPSSFKEFESLIQSRHHTLMKARAEVLPGQYKLRANRAGNTHFTEPALVQGTLEKGFERYLNLPKGLARAIFIMFLISEVHPFEEGNGRIARIMMNSELYSCGLITIIIPTVFGEDYLLSLRALTRTHRPKPLIQILTKAQKFSSLEFAPYPTVLHYLEMHNWFREPDEAKLIE